MKAFIPEIHRSGDIRAFEEKISRISMRVLVEGTRGKSSTVMLLEEMIRGTGARTLAKITGESPQIIHNGEHIDIFRERDNILLDYDNIPSVISHDVDAIIFENQAITPYTMRYIHHILRPRHIIIPNIRIDHTEGLGNDLAEMTENFARNWLVTDELKHVYYSEPIPKVHDLVFPILRDFAGQHPRHVVLHDVSIPPEYREIPGIENFCNAAAFMQSTFGIHENPAPFLRRITEKLKVKVNCRSVRYVNAAKINDPISLIHMLRYLLRQTPEQVALVAYFRKDRVGRSDIFEDFFGEIDEKFGDRIERIWFAGFGTGHVFKHLPPRLREKTAINTDSDDIETIIATAEADNLIVIPIINRVNPFMDRLYAWLEDPEKAGTRTRYAFSAVSGLRELPASACPEQPPADMMFLTARDKNF
ncbi:MAG: hypothetical protein APR53_01975 [Methanoculleus sp. SDB]|nr:MAG: hypothetical protein APR53_01975 [Methanoculleus sp. SDB]